MLQSLGNLFQTGATAATGGFQSGAHAAKTEARQSANHANASLGNIQDKSAAHKAQAENSQVSDEGMISNQRLTTHQNKMYSLVNEQETRTKNLASALSLISNFTDANNSVAVNGSKKVAEIARG